MLNLKERPYNLLLFAAFALSFVLILGKTTFGDSRNSPVFLIPVSVLFWSTPVLLIFYWLLYLITKQFMYSKPVIWLHIVFTILTALFMITVLHLGINPLEPIAHRYSNSNMTSNERMIRKSIYVVSIILACGQITYFANFALGLILRKKNSR